MNFVLYPPPLPKSEDFDEFNQVFKKTRTYTVLRIIGTLRIKELFILRKYYKDYTKLLMKKLQ